VKLLNIACGSTYHPAWINVDLVSVSPDVMAHDIRKGLPFADAYFDACYSSHVIEHLASNEAQKLVAECWRVLKPQSIVRVVGPDLETIVRNYLSALEQVENGITEAEPNYDWMMLELYDQTVRNFSGGAMKHYLLNSHIKNKDFILNRIGHEAEQYFLRHAISNKRSVLERIGTKRLDSIIEEIRIRLAKKLVALVAGKKAKSAFAEGLFRSSGEIHRWMYDRFSLQRLLEQAGFVDIRICRADESHILDFSSYALDVIEEKVRKPDSLFMEGMKQ